MAQSTSDSKILYFFFEKFRYKFLKELLFWENTKIKTNVIILILLINCILFHIPCNNLKNNQCVFRILTKIGYNIHRKS